MAKAQRISTSFGASFGQAHGRIIYKAFGSAVAPTGRSIRPLAWSDQKRRLQEADREAARRQRVNVINYVEPLHQDGATVYASVCRLAP